MLLPTHLKQGIYGKKEIVMTIADELNFERTPSGRMLSFMSDIYSGEPASTCVVKDGDDVGLRYQGITVILGNLVINPEGYLIGEIMAFGMHSSHDLGGLFVGKILTFRKEHIFHTTAKS